MPDPSRYDRFPENDLYEALEASMGETWHWIGQYRQTTDQEQALAMVERELETALVATRALRRKVGVRQSIR